MSRTERRLQCSARSRRTHSALRHGLSSRTSTVSGTMPARPSRGPVVWSGAVASARTRARQRWAALGSQVRALVSSFWRAGRRRPKAHLGQAVHQTLVDSKHLGHAQARLDAAFEQRNSRAGVRAHKEPPIRALGLPEKLRTRKVGRGCPTTPQSVSATDGRVAFARPGTHAVGRLGRERHEGALKDRFGHDLLRIGRHQRVPR